MVQENQGEERGGGGDGELWLFYVSVVRLSLCLSLSKFPYIDDRE